MNQTSSDNATFVVKYTNKDIVERIDSHYKDLSKIKDKIEDIHKMAIVTNGKVKWHTKAIWALGSLCMTILGFLVLHLTQSIK